MILDGGHKGKKNEKTSIKALLEETVLKKDEVP